MVLPGSAQPGESLALSIPQSKTAGFHPRLVVNGKQRAGQIDRRWSCPRFRGVSAARAGGLGHSARAARAVRTAAATGSSPGLPYVAVAAVSGFPEEGLQVPEVFRGHWGGSPDRADRTGYLRGTVTEARAMVYEFRALGCTRLSIAFREGPYGWEALEEFAAEIVRPN